MRQLRHDGTALIERYFSDPNSEGELQPLRGFARSELHRTLDCKNSCRMSAPVPTDSLRTEVFSI